MVIGRSNMTTVMTDESPKDMASGIPRKLRKKNIPNNTKLILIPPQAYP
jgi:hypothetical protein